MKKLNEIDVTAYFKKIGRKLTILLLVNMLLVVGIVFLGVTQTKDAGLKANSLEEELTKKELEELLVLKEKKELSNVELELAELKATFFDRDKNIQLINTLKEIEALMIAHSFNNTEHAVLPPRRNLDIFETPVKLEFVGEYAKVVNFLGELNATELPIVLRNLKVHVPEEEYEFLYKSTQLVKASLEVLVYEDKDHVEQLKTKIEEEIGENPFGYFVYSTPEESKEGITDYQKYLEEFNRLSKGEEESQNNEGVEEETERILDELNE